MSPTHTAGTIDLADARSPYEGSCRAHGNDGRAIRDILARIGDKWSLLVIATLHEGRLRFGELLGHIPGISQRMLTLTVRQLERDGVVTRTVYPEVPPRVEYELTDLGETLFVPARAIADWAVTHHDEIERARAEYDAR
ncbi:helix-turn-helix domain-containing protein [uncultured Microbacterium sp.]|uniref:winged helix-turn-helix transcriptional regulator n=1 Tax=uncultured Microbacterium sp. TaxID=191216 RepID=UPI0028E6CAA9|nr:helix-turn-helix domain-containing protein [uncultured Microbacterium sp.]